MHERPCLSPDQALQTTSSRASPLTLEGLRRHILARMTVHLAWSGFDADEFVQALAPLENFSRFYAFCGLTHHHPLHFVFSSSGLAGSYFLGKCMVERSLVYKSDVRGDELKTRGEICKTGGPHIRLHRDEAIHISDSFLIKTLVHNCSHDPEEPETFAIRNTIALPHANIHGTLTRGCFIGPFATVDLSTLHDCIVGEYAYVQAENLTRVAVPAGLVWIKSGDAFEFTYQHDPGRLSRYVSLRPGEQPRGMFVDFNEERQDAFQDCFDQACPTRAFPALESGALSPYAAIRGNCSFGENVLVCQRAYLENARLGRGANAQEHCSIIDSELEALNVTAHGGVLINCRMGRKVFVAFNAFLRGLKDSPLQVGAGCMIMPHTIIDLEEPLAIPEGHVVWGLIRNAADLAAHSLPVERIRSVQGEFSMGAMNFTGDGEALAAALEHRIEHILEANGAYYDGTTGLGHAQKNQAMSFNIIQPYAAGPFKGLYPTIIMRQFEA